MEVINHVAGSGLPTRHIFALVVVGDVPSTSPDPQHVSGAVVQAGHVGHHGELGGDASRVLLEEGTDRPVGAVLQLEPEVVALGHPPTDHGHEGAVPVIARSSDTSATTSTSVVCAS